MVLYLLTQNEILGFREKCVSWWRSQYWDTLKFRGYIFLAMTPESWRAQLAISIGTTFSHRGFFRLMHVFVNPNIFDIFIALDILDISDIRNFFEHFSSSETSLLWEDLLDLWSELAGYVFGVHLWIYPIWHCHLYNILYGINSMYELLVSCTRRRFYFFEKLKACIFFK